MSSFERLTCMAGRTRAGGEPPSSLLGRSRGEPLDLATRGLMEDRFGGDLARMPAHAGASGGRAAETEANRIAQAVAYPAARPAARGSFDFSRTRIHTSPEAAASSTAFGAMAYTSGRDIVFAPGRYRPDTAGGRELLAHELVHTIQQSRAPAAVAVQLQDAQPPTSASDTVLSVFPYANGSEVALATLFPDSLFGFAPNHISNWVHGFQDQQIVVSEATADVFRGNASAPMTPRGPGEGGTGGSAVSGVSIKVDRIGGGRFQIEILSGAKRLTAQEVRATRNQQGATVLTPVAGAPRPLSGAGKPASAAGESAKPDAAPLPGIEGPSKPERDQVALDALAALPKPPADAASADQQKISDGLSKMAEAFLKTPEGKRLTDLASKQAEKLPTVVLVAVPLVLVSAALAGLVATKTESPVTTSPDIPLPDIGGVKMKVKVTYKGPANRPTEASITLTFAKGSLEVAPAFKATWRDPTKPPSDDNRTGIEAGLSVKIPLGPDAKNENKEPSDTEKVRAEVADFQQQEAKFRASLRYKPGTPEANAAEAEAKAVKDLASRPFAPSPATPRPEGPWTSPQLLQSFDMKSGPGKRPWNLNQLSRQLGAAFAASPGATLRVVAIFDSVAGDTEEARKTNGERQDAAAANADVVKRALEQWLPPTKGRIETSVELKGTGRKFGVSADAAAEIGTRDVSVIFVPGAPR